MNKQFLFYILISVLFFSCNDEEIQDDNFNAADDFNRTIEINSYHVYDVPNALDSILPEVQVEIYSVRENFIDRINADAIRTTDSTGLCIFENRNKDYYWIVAEDDAFGIITDSVSTPANTISFVELLFY
ncbi:MAG: hypothetical protein H7Y00_11900 [Fimbriimonadaceae bacterium]|nr:hypothetical protein [Chitinophagales bacterium]